MEEWVTADNTFIDNKKSISHFDDHVSSSSYTYIRDSSYSRHIQKQNEKHIYDSAMFLTHLLTHPGIEGRNKFSDQ